MTENKSKIASQVLEEHNILRENILTLSKNIEIEVSDEE